MTNSPRAHSKSVLRSYFLTQRHHLAPRIHHQESCQIRHHLESIISQTHTVCAYVPRHDEPGTVQMLTDLAAHQIRILLPVIRATSQKIACPLSWGVYRSDQLSVGPWGILQPSPPYLDPSAISQAQWIIVPALAVDHHGTRLGRGRGYYDRSLPFRHPRAHICAIIRDQEFVAYLPSDPHDIPVSHVLTPLGGLRAL